MSKKGVFTQIVEDQKHHEYLKSIKNDYTLVNVDQITKLINIKLKETEEVNNNLEKPQKNNKPNIDNL